MPILKQLVTHPTASKRRSRADLTSEMISAPLGDFRHTMHIGRAGDAFGDTSFLGSKGDDQPESEESFSKPGLLSRTFRSSKRSLSVTRSDRRDMLGSVRDSAFFVKNAVSLPQLTEKEAEKSSSKKMPKSLSSSPVKKVPEEQHINGASAQSPTTVPDAASVEREFGELTDLPDPAPKSSSGMKHAESIMSFHIDLGPSMLGDILSVMDNNEWEKDLDHSLDDLDRNGSGLLPSWQTHPPQTGYPSCAPNAESKMSTSARVTNSKVSKNNHSKSRDRSVVKEDKSKKGRDFSFMDEEDEIRV
ncbi:CDC42 effector protein 4 L homeolog [Xenopus laevis]|uniref:CDC42 effector protein 4 L homeolog n=1 Tax=Xenopus laevis TaxID=8355 RepID=A2RVB7_XENLA|nr:CDC42 effector protein 4 L homeolog [Xenopus laevis]AAI33275.1 LOC100037164 protein [Xenopus laevis]